MPLLPPGDVKKLRRLAALSLLAVSGCAAQLATDPIQLTPVNEVALQDGTPIVRLIGYPGNARATVMFIFPSGETLTGDAVMNADVKNTMGIWGQVAQTVSGTSTVAMVAVNQPQKMACNGIFSPNATDLTCWLSDGAIYRNVYTAPATSPPISSAPKSAPGKG
jgi:hypothetical protein